jgi:transposase InsO family protein
MQLAATAVTGETARVVEVVLEGLFADHSAPLVLKSDNGKAFVARHVRRLLERHGVVALRGPVYRPQYNGSCERAGGHLKERAAHAARIAGDPGHWTVVDMERARVQANATARPHGARGPTPAEAFAKRRRVAAEERQ